MIRMHRILCPTDFSHFAARALDHAVALAGFHDAGLSVLHVSPLMPSVSGSGALAISPITLEPRSHERMVEMVREFAEPALSAHLATRCLVREGPIVSEILAEARESQADLLVMGTHGRGGFEHLMLGSVAEKVIRKAECPVLTVPAPAEGSVPHAPTEIHSIVCPMDFSPTSRLALWHALSLAELSKAKLTVLYVLEWPQAPLPGPHPPAPSEYREQLEFEALHELRAVIPPDARDRCAVHERVALGAPWRQIVRAIEDEHADMVVMGVQGANGLEQLVFGSTVNQVVRHATCPVLTVRPHTRT